MWRPARRPLAAGAPAQNSANSNTPFPLAVIVRFNLNKGYYPTDGWSFEGGNAILTNTFDEIFLGVRREGAVDGHQQPAAETGAAPPMGAVPPCQLARSLGQEPLGRFPTHLGSP